MNRSSWLARFHIGKYRSIFRGYSHCRSLWHNRKQPSGPGSRPGWGHFCCVTFLGNFAGGNHATSKRSGILLVASHATKTEITSPLVGYLA